LCLRRAAARRGAHRSAADRLGREHMENYKVPREVRVVDTLPLNASGKVDKSAAGGLRVRSGGAARVGDLAAP